MSRTQHLAKRRISPIIHLAKDILRQPLHHGRFRSRICLYKNADSAVMAIHSMQLRDFGIGNERHGKVDAPHPAYHRRYLSAARGMGVRRMSRLDILPNHYDSLSYNMDNHGHNGLYGLPYYSKKEIGRSIASIFKTLCSIISCKIRFSSPSL
mgnify:CR=1 FL=1